MPNHGNKILTIFYLITKDAFCPHTPQTSLITVIFHDSLLGLDFLSPKSPSSHPRTSKRALSAEGGAGTGDVTFASPPGVLADSQSSHFNIFSLEAVPPYTTHKQ